MKRVWKCAIPFILLLCLLSPGDVCATSLPQSFSQSYSQSIFYRRLCNVTLTGDQRTDIVNVAMSQVGYTEGNSGGDYGGLSQGNKNYTEYGLWYNLRYGPDGYERAAWCASFVSWCAYQAGIDEQTLYYHAFTPYGLSWFESCDRAYSRSQVESGQYTPLPGDIVYFKSDANDRRVNHVGIVIRYDNGILYAVEGNTYPSKASSEGGRVCLKSYAISDTFIRYICSPDYT